MKSSLFAVALLTAISFQGFAQDVQKDKESLKNFVRAVYEDYVSNPAKDLKANEFAAMFDRNFVGSEVQVDLKGDAQVSRNNLADLMADFERYRRLEGLSVKFTVKAFNAVHIKGKTGVVILDLDFQLFKNGEVISRGDQNVSLTARKYQDSWKITFMNRVFVQSEVYLGRCFCDLYGSEKEYMALLTVPDGDTYVTSTDQFGVAQSDDRRVIRMNGDDTYEWNPKSGELTKDGAPLGTALQASTAIKLILKYMHSDRCQSVVLTEK